MDGSRDGFVCSGHDTPRQFTHRHATRPYPVIAKRCLWPFLQSIGAMVVEMQTAGAISAIWSVVTVLVYAFSCLGFGWRIAWALVYREDRTDGVDLTTAFLLGIVVNGAFLTLLGVIGRICLMPVWILTLAGLIVGLPMFWGLAKRHWSASSVSLGLKQLPWSERLLSGGVIILSLGYVLTALITPPIGDAEAFYINYARLISETGKLTAMPAGFTFFSTISLPGELHFAALMTIGDLGAAKLFAIPVAFASAVFLSRICSICGGGPTSRLVLAVILLSSSTFMFYAIDGKVDLFAAAFGLAAVYWALLATLEKRHARMLVWVGLMSGAATVSKFSYLPTLVPTLFVLLIWRNLDGRHGTLSRASVVTGMEILRTSVWATLPWVPHLVKNAAVFGAPLAPFIGGPQDGAWLNQVWFAPDVTNWILATYPFALVFGRYPMMGGSLSFVMLAFAPFIWLVWKELGEGRQLLRRLAYAGFAGLVIWVALRPSIIAPRYFLATVLLFVPVLAVATEHFLRRFSAYGVLRFGVICVMWAALAGSSWHVLPTLRALPAYAVGTLDQCAMASDYCAPQRLLAEKGTPQDRVFVAGYYTYWLRTDQLLCGPNLDEAKSVHEANAPVNRLQALGFRYLVADGSSHDQILRAAAANQDATLLMQTGQIYLFEIELPEDSKPICPGGRPNTWSPAWAN